MEIFDKISKIFILYLLLCNISLFSQQQDYPRDHPQLPEYFIPKNHNPNIKSLPQKSFYQSRDNWQYIIDTTWGPGVPLGDKLLIYNTYAQKVHDEFDGFLSLGLNFDSLYYHYLPEITDSTSAGAFAAIMAHFAYDLKDYHTYALNNNILNTPLNPGIPILILGSFTTVEHFGAVTTVLPDSTTLVLRVVPGHPLNLEPGDIILGYEGMPWKDLVTDLMDAGLPLLNFTGGCNSANNYLNLSCAGMNWHLFNTIDILKHSTGDTVHLSVAPLLNLNVPPMVNNEQLPVGNIPFPDVLSNECVTYGILDNTNIGYIYLAQEYPESTADIQFNTAIDSLKNTDALIIDMRLNFGGWALFENAFKILFNDYYRTIEDAYRCNTNTFELCPSGDYPLFEIQGLAPALYDRPIAVLLGPTCVSMGDLTAQRFRYHPMVKFFGKSSDASLGDNVYLNGFSGWTLKYSISDMFHTNEPEIYLNRREFPIDFPVWHNPDDVSSGKDAVVDEAIDWINNWVYPHNIALDKSYYVPGTDSIKLSSVIENPNSHQLTAKGYVHNLDNILIDSVSLTQQTAYSRGENWNGTLISPSVGDFFKVSVTVFDETDSTSFTLPNAARFATSGPVVLDSIYQAKVTYQSYVLRAYLRNTDTSQTITNAQINYVCNDPWFISFHNQTQYLPDIPPGETVSTLGFTTIFYDTLQFPGYFNIKVEISKNNWVFWSDSTKLLVPVRDEKNILPVIFNLDQNFPNPFNPATTIRYSIPKVSKVQIKVFDVLGKEIRILVNEEKPAGTYELTWNAANLPSGVYFYQIKAGEFTGTKKMILLK
jgi:hypothetical protein